MSKKLLENKPLKYLVITDPDGGHEGLQVGSITLKEAKKLLKTEDIIVYIFKMPTRMYNKPMLKYPLGEYYNYLEINNYTDDVMNSLNLINKQDIDFTEYIEITDKYNEIYKEYEYEISYKIV
jgi:hypothetical protein